MTDTHSYPVTSDAFRTMKLWFEQQIENAQQDQISGFAERSERGTMRGEKAHSRHCAMFDALQMFLSEFGTVAPAQQAVDCGEMVRVAKMAKAAAEMELGLAAPPDFSPRDMLDAANAALSTLPSTTAQEAPGPLSLQAVREDERLACWKIAEEERKNAAVDKQAWLVAFDIANAIKARGYSLPSTHYERPTVIGRVTGREYEGDQVSGMPWAICHACGLKDYPCANPDCPKKAFAISSTDPRCTCAAIVNPDIPHARFCPLSSTSRDSASTYCALCDHEHQLHEDAQGFHHVVKGARVACPFPTESK